MNYISRIFAILLITITLTTYGAEDNPKPSYWSSAWSYVSSPWKNISTWLYSWIEDKRTSAEITADNKANKTAFEQAITSADALITDAEQLHQNIIADNIVLDDKGTKKTNDFIQALETSRLNLSLLQRRLLPTYVKDAAEGITNNFKLIKGFDHTQVYPFLAKEFEKQGIIEIAEPILAKNTSVTQKNKVQEMAVKDAGTIIQTTFSAKKIVKQIDKLIDDAQKQNNADALKKLRQIKYLFLDEQAKKEFDAFLLDGEEGGLNSLQITDSDGSKMNRVNDLIGRLQMIKAELQNDLR